MGDDQILKNCVVEVVHLSFEEGGELIIHNTYIFSFPERLIHRLGLLI